MQRICSARRLATPSLWLAVGVAACGETKPKVPASINKLSDNQTAAAGTAVRLAPSVSILDADGKGIGGITVTFTLSSGGGSLAGAAITTTNSAGVATAGTWTLGPTVGTNTVIASAQNVPGSPVVLTAIGVAGPPAALAKTSVDRDSTATSTNIDSIQVKVTDQFGNAVGGATVSFAVTAGGGTIATATTLTSGNGLAAARWTVGPTVGALNTATATVVGVAQPVSFNTIGRLAIWGARFAQTVYVVDSSGTTSVGVTALDPGGNPIPTAAIPLTLRTAAAATVSGTTVSGARTGQSFIIGIPQDNPTAKDSAILIVANTTAPVVRAGVPRFDLKTDTTLTIPIIIDMRSSGLSVGAATLQVSWDPTVLLFQSSATGASGVAVTSNETSAPAGTITMTFASTSGFANKVEVRTLTFKTGATAGKSGTLNLTALDLVSTSAIDLRAKTVTSFYPMRTR